MQGEKKYTQCKKSPPYNINILCLLACSRDMTHSCDFLKQLADLDLITLDGWDVKNKTTVSWLVDLT